MDWTAGYASDLVYTAGFYREQAPAFLNLTCVLNGYEPVALDKSFTYCELGFGRGLTANVLAATHPQGKFYATDFNPAHVAEAREICAAAALPNLTLLEHSFADLNGPAGDALPEFDFITLHGIYTWVTPENQQHIVSFIEKKLKAGGLVFLSYNAMPGWTPHLPLQRLLVDHADSHPDRSDKQVSKASEFVTRLQSLNAAYFTANPAVTSKIDMLKAADAKYLVHEYMHRHWQPLYHADVAKDVARAKLEFVGVADLPLAFYSMYLSPEQRALLGEIEDGTLRQTVVDYMLNTSFRRDVYVRGARKMSPARAMKVTRELIATLIVPRHKATLKMKVGLVETNGRDELYIPVLDALAQRPHSIEELNALPALKSRTVGDVFQIVIMLVASSQAICSFRENRGVSQQHSDQMNKVIAERACMVDDYQVLAAPFAGTAIAASYIERFIYLVLDTQTEANNVRAIVDAVRQLMSSYGHVLNKDGKPLVAEHEISEELTRLVRDFIENKLSMWRQLGVTKK